MSTELETNLNNILYQKATYLIPENIKKGVTALSVTGTYEGTGGIDWTQIGYAEEPESLSDMVDYSKSIYDNWDNSQTDLSQKFSGDEALVYMPLVDTSNSTIMRGMFSSCTNLAEVPLLATTNVTDMASMFLDCQNLRKVAQLDTSDVEYMTSMFENCYQLEEVPLFDTGSVIHMGNMFVNCYQLVTVPELDTSNVENMTNMFSYCELLSDTSLNNILAMCANATNYTGEKTLAGIGISSHYSPKISTLSNFQSFIDAGWTV